MPRTRKPEFGRRAPPALHRPEGLPGGQQPASPTRKRTLVLSLVAAGAVAAAGAHFAEGSRASGCTPAPSAGAAGATVAGSPAFDPLGPTPADPCTSSRGGSGVAHWYRPWS